MGTGDLPFIGRQRELNAFHSLLSLREQKSALYVEAAGGLGKTRYLKQIFEEYRDQPRWYFKPPDSSVLPLIDFFDLANRSVAGLRRSIIKRLGEDHFKEFKKTEAELLNAETGKTGTASLTAVYALQRQADELFFKEFRNAISEIRKYVTLLFDTFEVAHHRRVGRWFLNEFLRRQETAGCLVVFAGRPPRPSLPVRARAIELAPWSQAEVWEYLTKHFQGIPSEFKQEEAIRIHATTEGHPLLVDMVVYTRNSKLAPLDELANMPRARLEHALINRIAQSTEPEHIVLLEMGYLNRRFDPHIFAFRQKGYPAYAGIKSFDTLVNTLQNDPSPAKRGFSSMTKYRPTDQVLTLHDEVQRMIAQHAFSRDWDFPGPRREWKERSKELYEDVVIGFYPKAIEEAKTEDERGLLTAEHLAYLLDYDLEEGLKYYNQLFETSWQRNAFSFIELIWGEIVDRLEKEEEKFKGREFELCYPMADWLWTTDQFEAAIEVYSLIVNKYTPNPQDALRKLEALASLGHAYMELGQFAQSKHSFEQGLSLAKEINNNTWLSAFQQNMGQLLTNINKWDEAEDWFKKAVNTAMDGGIAESEAISRVNLGYLQARLGQYNNAIINCQKALNLRYEIVLGKGKAENVDPYFETIINTPFSGYFSPGGELIRLAIANLRLADSYRYSGAHDKALHNYSRALEILKPASGYRYECEALQGIANIFHDEAHDERLNNKYADSIKSLNEAFEYLDEAISLCREHRLERQLPQALHRLGHVFYEISELEKTMENRKIDSLVRRANEFLLPEEDRFQDRREEGSFSQLETIGKAQRLFEVSSFEAEQSNVQDYNTSLDSLVEAGEIALQRGRFDDVRSYARLAHLPSDAYQEELFSTLVDLTLADLDLVEGRTDHALNYYEMNFPEITKRGGYGSHLIRDRLYRLGARIQKMPVEQGLRWCDKLIQAWEGQGLSNTHPYLIGQMWEYRNLIMEQIKLEGSNN